MEVSHCFVRQTVLFSLEIATLSSGTKFKHASENPAAADSTAELYRERYILYEAVLLSYTSIARLNGF